MKPRALRPFLLLLNFVFCIQSAFAAPSSSSPKWKLQNSNSAGGNVGTGNSGNGVGNTGPGNQGNDKTVGNAGGGGGNGIGNGNANFLKILEMRTPTDRSKVGLGLARYNSAIVQQSISKAFNGGR